MADGQQEKKGKLPTWGNEATMNLNSMVLTNIQGSPYFKVQLFNLKTYHEVVDEIYYKVDHLEPWEKGSRKTQGQTGMCGGVRGVGAGGIVSSAFCLLYKLYTLKLTRKQLTGLINHTDSPFIRGLGFMFIRYTQPPKDLWDWFEPYLDDEEEIDPKAGGGCPITIGDICRQFLVKLEWYGTLFPRIPVPVHKLIDQNMKARQFEQDEVENREREAAPRIKDAAPAFRDIEHTGRSSRPSSRERDSHRGNSGFRKKTPPFDIAKAIADEKDRQRHEQGSSSSQNRDSHRHDSRSKDIPRKRSRSRDRHRHRSRSRERHSNHRHRSRSRDKRQKDRRSRSRSRDKRRSPHGKSRSNRSRSHDREKHRR